MLSIFRNKFHLNACSALLLTLAVCSCGGGGGDSGDKIEDPTPPENIAPTADAGSDQIVDELTVVTLSGSGSDADGEVVSYSWEQIAGTPVTLFNPSSASASFTAPDINTDVSLSFELTVIDNNGSNGKATVEVIIKAVGFSGVVITENAKDINSTNAKISGRWNITSTESVDCVTPYWSSDITVEMALNGSPVGLCSAVNQRETTLSNLTCGTTYKYLYAIREKSTTSWTNAIKGEVKEFTTIACDASPEFPVSFEQIYIELDTGLETLTEGQTIIAANGQYLLAKISPDAFISNTELKFEISKNGDPNRIYTDSEDLSIGQFIGLAGAVIPDSLECGSQYKVRGLAKTQWSTVFSDYYNIEMTPCDNHQDNQNAQHFKVTSEVFDETQDSNQACIDEFGSNHQIADWNHIVDHYNTYLSMDDFFSTVAMPALGQEGTRSLQVSKDGDELYNSNRHYFITRHDHDLPGHYLSHANIDDHLIDLGSWNGAHPVLCLKQNNTQTIESIEDAYGNVTTLISTEETTGGKVESTLKLVNEEQIEASVKIFANETPLALEFIISDKNIINTTNKGEVRIEIEDHDGGHKITIPKSMMESWASSDVVVSSNGKEIPVDALVVIDDDPVLFWNSELTRIGDYVTAVNTNTEEKGNKAIETSAHFWNEYHDDPITLSYQVLYYANYSILNNHTRNLHIRAQLAEDDLLEDDYIGTPQEIDMTSTVAGRHTNGVYYHIGADGWYAQDAKTLDIIDRGGESEIGSFEFEWTPQGWFNLTQPKTAEFFAHITVTDGNLEEEYDGDHLHFNKKVPYLPPSIKIISPTLGEQVSAGTTHQIKWESYYFGENLDITLSSGEDKALADNFTIIDRFTYTGNTSKHTGKFEWSVPTTPSSAHFIKFIFPATRLGDGAGWLDGASASSFSEQFSITGTIGPICDANNLNLCTSNNTCLSAGGYWYDGDCHSETKEANPPTASFTSNCNNLSCSFNASSSFDTDGSISTYMWNFGDNTDSSGLTVNHTYDNAGSYIVALAVTDESGLADTKSQLVTVSEAAPIVPQNLKAVAGNEEITVTWDSIPDATSYVIYLSTTSKPETGFSFRVLTGESSTTFTFDSLTNGTTYYFAVYSTVNRTRSEWSEEVSAIPVTDDLPERGIWGRDPKVFSNINTCPAPALDGNHTLYWSPIGDSDYISAHGYVKDDPSAFVGPSETWHVTPDEGQGLLKTLNCNDAEGKRHGKQQVWDKEGRVVENLFFEKDLYYGTQYWFWYEDNHYIERDYSLQQLLEVREYDLSGNLLSKETCLALSEPAQYVDCRGQIATP